MCLFFTCAHADTCSQSDELLQELFHDEQCATLLNDTGFRRSLGLPAVPASPF